MENNLKDKLKKPACGDWISLDKEKPKLFQFVLVNTQYCRYPAQTALWNGVTFKSTDGGKYANITHWAEINDIGKGLKPEYKTDFELLKNSIECLEKSFDVIRLSKIKNENIEMIFESIGFQISNLYDELGKIKYKSEPTE